MIFPGNVDTMTENLEFLVDLGMNCPDFMPVRDDIWSVDDLHNFRKECHRLADRTLQYFEDGQIVAVVMFYLAIRDTLIGLTKSKRPFGCFAGTHGAIMSVEGKFFPCARFASKKLLPMVGEEYNFEFESIIHFEFWSSRHIQVKLNEIPIDNFLLDGDMAIRGSYEVENTLLYLGFYRH